MNRTSKLLAFVLLTATASPLLASGPAPAKLHSSVPHDHTPHVHTRSLTVRAGR